MDNCHNFLFCKTWSVYIHIPACQTGTPPVREPGQSQSAVPLQVTARLAVFDFFCQCYTQSCVRHWREKQGRAIRMAHTPILHILDRTRPSTVRALLFIQQERTHTGLFCLIQPKSGDYSGDFFRPSFLVCLNHLPCITKWHISSSSSNNSPAV